MSAADFNRARATFVAFALMLASLGFRRSGRRFTRPDFAGNIYVTDSTRGEYLVGFINDNPAFEGRCPRDFADLLLSLSGRETFGAENYRWAWEQLEVFLAEQENLGPEARELENTLKGPAASCAVRQLAQRMSKRGFPVNRTKLKSMLEVVREDRFRLEKDLARRLRVTRAKINTTSARNKALRKHPQLRKDLDRAMAAKTTLTRLADAPGGANHANVTWHPSSAITGRWGASPHVLSLSRDLRAVCRPEPGQVVVVGDLGAADVVVAGVLSGEKHLARAASRDVYLDIATRLFGTDKAKAKAYRSVAKVLTLKSLYNAGPETLRRSLAKVHPGISVEVAAALLGNWRDAHPRYVKWRWRLYCRARQTGRLAISSRRVISFEGGDLTHEGQPAAWCVQGTVAALFDQMLLKLDSRLRSLGCSAQLVGMVHDSAVVVCADRDAERVARVVRSCLRAASVGGRSYRFRVDVRSGRSWGDLEGAGAARDDAFIGGSTRDSTPAFEAWWDAERAWYEAWHEAFDDWDVMDEQVSTMGWAS